MIAVEGIYDGEKLIADAHKDLVIRAKRFVKEKLRKLTVKVFHNRKDNNFRSRKGAKNAIFFKESEVRIFFE